jgi:D-psicose/D-tagatose/L-ribulose 3-epimerase
VSLLSHKDVRKSFRPVEALRGVAFAVMAGEAVALLADHGITPYASLRPPPTAMARRDPEAAERFLLQAVAIAHGLGCRFLGGVTYSALGYKSGSPPTEAEYDNIARALRPVAQRAAELGMSIGLEPCNRYETHLLNTAEQGLRLFDRIGEPNLILHLDTYHMNIEEKGIGRAVEIAGRSASDIHLSESDRGVPGTGTVDWDDVFATVAKAGFDRDLVIESLVTLPPAIASAPCVWRPVAKDRREVLDSGVTFLKDRARVHGVDRNSP